MTKEYYWGLLDQVTGIEDEEFAHKSQAHVEADNLKAMAFAGLIRFGEHFQIESNLAEIEKIKAENKKSLFGSETPVPELHEVLKIKKMDNTVYSIDTELLQKCMKSDYNKLVLKEDDKPVAEQVAEVISMPDINPAIEEDEIELEPVTEEEIKEMPKAETNTRTASYVPKLIGDLRYDRDPHYTKALSSFCFNHIRLTLEFEKGKNAVVDFNVFPLVFVEDAPITDIMVTAISGRTIRAGISRGFTSSVELKFDQMAFMIRGSWKDGKFVTQVNCLDGRFAGKFKEKTTAYMPEARTYMTYMQEEIYNKTYHFFPASVATNADNGFAMCAAVIVEGDNELSVAVSNEENVFTVIDPDGVPEQLSLYWSGGQNPVLHLEVEEQD